MISFQRKGRLHLRNHLLSIRFATTVCAGVLLIAITVSVPASFAANLTSEIALVGAADGTPSADKAAAAAAKQLESLPSSNVIEVLQGFGKATERGRNWLRALAADVCDNGSFPAQQLDEFYADQKNDPDARYVAFQLLIQNDPSKRAVLLAKAETDPSLPLRFLRIDSLIKQAASFRDQDERQAKQILQTVIENGRSASQLEKAGKMLEDLGVKVDLAGELGMIRRWWVIGPFDNTDSKDFDTAYTPENRYLESGSPINGNASADAKPEKGKSGDIRWQRIESDDKLGMVDLNAPLNNAKDAVAYAFATFTIDETQSAVSAQVRIGCITANKVWVNGKLVSSNEVYHSGSRIDQYIDPCELQAGENTVLVKVLQNAQTEPWAQDWQFQFRFTRPNGGPINVSIKEN